MNVCEALETVWRDPYNRSEIKDFIWAWLNKKAEKKTKICSWSYLADAKKSVKNLVLCFIFENRFNDLFDN